MPNYNQDIQQNNTELDEILQTVNNLPEAGGESGGKWRFINKVIANEGDSWLECNTDSNGNPFKLKKIAVQFETKGTANGGSSFAYLGNIVNAGLGGPNTSVKYAAVIGEIIYDRIQMRTNSFVTAPEIVDTLRANTFVPADADKIHYVNQGIFGNTFAQGSSMEIWGVDYEP